MQLLITIQGTSSSESLPKSASGYNFWVSGLDFLKTAFHDLNINMFTMFSFGYGTS